MVDEAGNSFTTQASSYQILPGLDLFWNISETNVDRIVVRPGEQTGNITITSVLESNEDYGGSVIVRLETAPADRSASVDWTVMETRNSARWCVVKQFRDHHLAVHGPKRWPI